MLLEEAGLILDNDLMKFIYDSTGESYKVPYACINEPLGYGEDVEAKKIEGHSKPEESKMLTLKIRNALKFEDKELEIDWLESVRSLKE